MTAIETPRLVLRPPEASDVPTMMLIHQDPEVMRYLGSGVAGDISVAWRNVAMMIGHWHMRGYGPWIVVAKDGGEILGRAGLWNIEGGPGVELGWMIRRSAWGNGFATEASRAALEWAWQHVETAHIISVIRAENVASIRIASKLGQRLEFTNVVDGVTMYTFGVHRHGTSAARILGARSEACERRDASDPGRNGEAAVVRRAAEELATAEKVRPPLGRTE